MPPPDDVELVLEPSYWQARLAGCEGEAHRAIFAGSAGQYEWEAALMREEVLAAGIGPDDSILDVGCGFGVLVGWLEATGWRGGYLGVDVTPEFVAMARARHPGREFAVGDARLLAGVVGRRRFDWAVAVWLKSMVLKHAGHEVWGGVEAQMRACARRVLTVR